MVVPVTTMELALVRASSAGEIMVKLEDVGWGEVEGDGAGEVVSLGTEEGVGVAEAKVDNWACLRLRLAVQMPKVISKPKAKPIIIAKVTSFLIIGARISDECRIVKVRRIVYF